jgi:hypothetical protein
MVSGEEKRGVVKRIGRSVKRLIKVVQGILTWHKTFATLNAGQLRRNIKEVFLNARKSKGYENNRRSVTFDNRRLS